MQLVQILDIVSASTVITPFAEFPLKSIKVFFNEKYDGILLTFMLCMD